MSAAAESPAANGRIHHFKLVLLGDTAVGKSCLVVRFVRDEFFEFQEPTIGGEFGWMRRSLRVVEGNVHGIQAKGLGSGALSGFRLWFPCSVMLVSDFLIPFFLCSSRLFDANSPARRFHCQV